MPNKRINMRKIRDILRLRFEAGLSWLLPEGMSESRLASLLYPESDSRPGRLEDHKHGAA